MTRAQALVWGRGVTRRVALRDVPLEVLALVDERQGGRYCVDCRELGLVTPKSVPLELDHVMPLFLGGDHSHRNLTWRCRSHNRSKKAKTPREARTSDGTPRRPRWERRRG